MDPRVAQTSPQVGNYSVIRAMILALLLVVSVEYIFLWFMQPTKQWMTQVEADANSTYFEAQGRNMLMYVFPVLFVAALGCVYLHLGKKCNDECDFKKAYGKQGWKRPVIIKGLGIVSRIELAFFTMFIALLVWYFSVSLSISYAKITPMSATKSGPQVWEVKLKSAALSLALVGNICLAFLFFPVTRGSSVLQVFGLTSEASIKYHIWLGHISMTLFIGHSVCCSIFWAFTNELYKLTLWNRAAVSNVAGVVSMVAGLVMWATTFPRIRRKMFELFFYTHHFYIIFMLFYVLHVGISYTFLILPNFYLFMIDRYLRFLQSRQNVRLISARILPCQTLELNFSKTEGLNYTPTSILFLNIPSISKLQWHPFTISSSSSLEPETLSVIIKAEGSWTKKLYQIVSSPSPIDHLDVSVEGPYGPTSTDFLRYDLLVMVSGGSGVTPFVSIIRELMHASETIKCKTPSILLISAFKDSSDLTMLDLLLPMVGSPTDFPNLELQIEAYVTKEKEPTLEAKNRARIVWFKPKPSDSPITPILGKNSWLWLGAIISTSFIIFLIFLGVITRYYMYPTEYSTNQVYPWSSRAVLNILIMCIAIIITTTVAFLWNKKQNAKGSKKIHNIEAATPAASPNSLFYYADRELESLPQQSLVLPTNVHYGERPDLKKFLFERKESCVGVLVCGPKKMRHEVANICSSGLGPNLHFESISFSW